MLTIREWEMRLTMFCVVMGDVVTSRMKDELTRNKVLHAADDLFARINAEYRPDIVADFGMVRGDAFEGILIAPRHALKIANELIKGFYQVDKTCLRVCVAVGELTVVRSDRNKADGPVFEKAMAAIERMKKEKSGHWFQLAIETELIGQPLIESLLEALTFIANRWTDRQREIVWAMEAAGGNHKAVAAQLGVVVSSIYGHSKAAAYSVYQGAWENLERYFRAVNKAAVGGWQIQPSYTNYYSAARERIESGLYVDAHKYLKKAIELAKAEPGDHQEQIARLNAELSEVLSKIQTK